LKIRVIVCSASAIKKLSKIRLWKMIAAQLTSLSNDTEHG
jgi:hypothetical protein